MCVCVYVGVHACVLHVYTPVKTWVEKHAHQGGGGPRHRAWLSWCGFSAWPRQSERMGFPQYHCPPGARMWQPPQGVCAPSLGPHTTSDTCALLGR